MEPKSILQKPYGANLAIPHLQGIISKIAVKTTEELHCCWTSDGRINTKLLRKTRKNNHQLDR